LTKNGWATFWAIFSQKHLVTLHRAQKSGPSVSPKAEVSASGVVNICQPRNNGSKKIANYLLKLLPSFYNIPSKLPIMIDKLFQFKILSLFRHNPYHKQTSQVFIERRLAWNAESVQKRNICKSVQSIKEKTLVKIRVRIKTGS
jgi:hypothetical protein